MLGSMRSDLRVQFIHGLESSPQGAKAQLFARHFTALTPAMNTRDFAASVAVQAQALREFEPHVLVGSSYGGAIAVELLQRGLWRGPTLLLAQAALRCGLAPELPSGVDVWLVHGTRDDIIDPEDSRVLARSGSPGSVRLIEIDDVHALHTTVEDGRLVAWVEQLAPIAVRSRSLPAGPRDRTASRDRRSRPP
jgi:pimeloyl-ACP methyl ester carboxylesterase